MNITMLSECRQLPKRTVHTRRLRPSEGIMSSKLCDLDWRDDPPPGFGAPRLVIVQQRIPRPMTPLKVWRGFYGNMYFEPLKIRGSLLPNNGILMKSSQSLTCTSSDASYYNHVQHRPLDPADSPVSAYRSYSFHGANFSHYDPNHIASSQMQHNSPNISRQETPQLLQKDVTKLDYLHNSLLPTLSSIMKPAVSPNNSSVHPHNSVKFDVVIPTVIVENDSSLNSYAGSPESGLQYHNHGYWKTGYEPLRKSTQRAYRQIANTSASQTKHAALIRQENACVVGSLKICPYETDSHRRHTDCAEKSRLCKGNTVRKPHNTLAPLTSAQLYPDSKINRIEKSVLPHKTIPKKAKQKCPILE